MTEERRAEISGQVMLAVELAHGAMYEVTLEEVREVQAMAKNEESKFHALGPILNPTMYLHAGANPYETVYKRLELATLAVDPRILTGTGRCRKR